MRVPVARRISEMCQALRAKGPETQDLRAIALAAVKGNSSDTVDKRAVTVATVVAESPNVQAFPGIVTLQPLSAVAAHCHWKLVMTTAGKCQGHCG